MQIDLAECATYGLRTHSLARCFENLFSNTSGTFTSVQRHREPKRGPGQNLNAGPSKPPIFLVPPALS